MFQRPKGKIRYAVVGLGYIAQTAVLPAFRHAESNSELVALVSGDQEKLERLGREYGLSKLYLYSQFEQCLQSGEVDAVYICTPNSYHRNIMETAAKYGVHVLCEKPMAVTAEDCLSMIHEADKNNIRLMIGYRLHFEAANLEAIKIAHSKRIGELKVFQSLFTMQVTDPQNIRLVDTEEGGGPLYDIGIYCINAARYLFKAEPIEVFAMTASSHDGRFKQTDESINCVMKFSEARLASFTISFGAFRVSEFDLVGSKGRIRLEKAYNFDRSMTLKTYEDNKIYTKRFSKRDQFAPELIYFSDCIQKKKRPEPSGEEGFADIKIIEAILLSIDLGAPIMMEEMNKRHRPNQHQKITTPTYVRPKLFHAFSPTQEKH